jgi:tetratricopeptide (TPR) repeat protein
MNNLAMLYSDTRRFDEGEALHKQVLEGFRATLGPDHPYTLTSTHNLGYHYWLQLRHDEAEPLFRRALEGRRRKLSPDHAETLRTMQNLGVVLRDSGHYDEAEPLLREAAERAKKTLGPASADTQAYVANFAVLHHRRGTSETAEPMVREAVEVLRSQGKTGTAAFADQLGRLSRCLLDQKKYAEAEAVLRDCIASHQNRPSNEWVTFHMRSLLGSVLLDQKRFAEAEPFLLQGYQGLKEREAELSKDSRSRIVQALERLVELYDAWGKEAEAARWRKHWEDEKTHLK